MPKETQRKTKFQTFSDTIGARAFPNAKDADLKSIVGVPIIIKDVVVKAMKFGDVAIILFNYAEDDERIDWSVLAGGVVIRKKCLEAKAQKLLPLIGTIVYDDKYYDIV